MNEIKDIKEIAKIIDKSRKLYVEDYESISMYFTPDEYFAKKIIEKGYQNCQDKVVLTKEEYEKLKNLEKYHITLEDLIEYISAARKETAREIVKALKNMAYQSNDWSHGVHPMVVEVDDIEEIAQKYGVEIDNE